MNENTKNMPTISDDIDYLKNEINKILKRSSGNPDGIWPENVPLGWKEGGSPNRLSSSDYVRIRELRKERLDLVRKRWESEVSQEDRMRIRIELSDIQRRNSSCIT
tara:strand:+ start:6595 stop:6912 length:318 start_codon:yes stop_codon:yes gene_type:complete